MKDTDSADLAVKLESLAREMGTTHFGIADLAPARERISEQGGEFLGRFPRAVSHGFALADGVVNTLVHHKSIPALHTYRHYVYQTVNPRLDSTSLTLAQALEQAGFQAYVVPASQTLDRTGLVGVFSHKLAAHLAGLGWIGKSALLITPEHGPRVRWGTVLTDAPLEAGTPMDENCRDCDECVKACPAHAFTGQAFDKPRPRGDIFAAEACDRYLCERETFHRVCGMCVHICPFGRKN
jgi:epoxyqueuosine reductase